MSGGGNNSEGERGEGEATTQELDVVTLTYNRVTDKLDIGGMFTSYDRALDMLERARRSLDATWKVQFMKQQQAEAIERERVAGIVRRIGERR